MRLAARRFFLACTGVLLLVACSDGSGRAGASASAPLQAAAVVPSVGLALSNGRNPFFKALREGAENAARDGGLRLVVEDAGDDTARQARQVRSLIARKVAVLLLNPTDSRQAASLVEAAGRAGIAVVTLDRSVSGGPVAVHIASDNVAGGRMAAAFIKDRLQGRGRVVELLGVPEASASIERDRGFAQALREAPGLRLVAREAAGFDRARARAVMTNVLNRLGPIDAVFALNDEMALGAIDALRAADRGRVVVVGFDASPGGLAAIRAGDMAATIGQRPDLIGREGVQAARQLLARAPVESRIPVPLELVKP